MPKSLCGFLTFPALAAVFLAAGGCKPGGDNSQAANNPPPPPPNPVAVAGPNAGAGNTGGNPSIREVMGKVARGPMSLTPMLGNELKADPPDWPTIQGQTKEFTQLADALGKDTPPRGTPESWAKLTGDYAGSVAALDHAAQAKDRDAALAAHKQVAESCNACHQAHRPMRGPGGPPGR